MRFYFRKTLRRKKKLNEQSQEDLINYLEEKISSCQINLEKPRSKRLPKNWLIGCIAGLRIAEIFMEDNSK